MIITTTGFYNTGSSAVTNILEEFDGVSVKDNVYEMRLLYDPDGIDDLRYHLVDCPHRQNSSHALKKFKKYIDYNSNKFANHHYEAICNGNFRKISYEYINEITLFKYHGVSHIEAYEKGVAFTFFNRIYQKIYRLVQKYFKVGLPKDSLLSNRTKQYATVVDEEQFLKPTRDYVGKIMKYATGDEPVNVVDQLFPPSNIARYREYLPCNEKVVVFIVDRDPRDLYTICKYFSKTKAIPCKNPKEFCDWFKWTRAQSTSKPDPEYVHRIQFEDMVYDYENIREKMASWCHLDINKCSKKGLIFKPQQSINNTQTWYRYPESKEEIEYIEKELKEYCFDFSKYKEKPTYGKKNMFEC